MWPNSQFPADLVTFTEEILDGELYFSGSSHICECSDNGFLHLKKRLWYRHFPVNLEHIFYVTAPADCLWYNVFSRGLSITKEVLCLRWNEHQHPLYYSRNSGLSGQTFSLNI